MSAETEAEAERRAQRRTDRLEMLFTLTMALAAIGTAWAGFESTKWRSLQGTDLAQASVARTEANRKFAEAGQLRTLDVITFTQWLNAVNAELRTDPGIVTADGYAPRDGSASKFLYDRFRPEFHSAFDAWLAERPLFNPDAPGTPFVMPDYHLASQAEAEEQLALAESLAARSHEAGALSDNYVLTSVLFALVLFFVAVGNKASSRTTRRLLFGLSAITFLGTLAVLSTFPVAF